MLVRLAIAGFLLAHAAIHIGFISPRPPVTAGGPRGHSTWAIRGSSGRRAPAPDALNPASPLQRPLALRAQVFAISADRCGFRVHSAGRDG
jgi:hypothetical protein